MSTDISRKNLLKDGYTHKETQSEHQQSSKSFHPWKEAALEKVKQEQFQKEQILKGVKALMEMGRKYGGWLEHMSPEDIQTLTAMVKQDQSLLHHFCQEDLQVLASQQREHVDRVESGKERGKELFDPWIERARDEHGNLVERSVNLATESTPEKPLLLGKGYTGEGSSQRNVESDYSSNSSCEEIKKARKEAIDRGKYKMLLYENEAELWRHEDRDTFELFEKEFITERDPYEDCGNALTIKSEACNGEGEFSNRIDIVKGKIRGVINAKKSTNWDFSEIVYNQLLFILKNAGKDVSQFNITKWTGQSINNTDTIDVAKLFVSMEDKDEKGLEGRKTFYENDEGFVALAGTETARSKFYMLAQHQKAFKGKKVKSITVDINPEYSRKDKIDFIEIKYEIA